MKQRLFEERHRDEWSQLAQQLAHLEAGRGRRRKFAPFLADLPRAHRRLCHQQALARERGYSLSLIRELDQLMLRSHRQLYRKPQPLWSRLTTLLSHDFPRSVRAQGRWNLISALALVGTGVLVATLVRLHPDMVYSVLAPDQARNLASHYESRQHPGRTSGDNLLMFGYYIMHNIGLAFQTFASGLFLGVGSLLIILFNGVFLGAATAHMINLGHGEAFFTFVVAHSAPELTAIVLAGGSGLRLGWALVAPGPRRRLDALRSAALATLPVLYGMVILLLTAAFIEAFWSPLALPPVVKYSVGGTIWALLFLYLALAGRGPNRRERHGWK